MDISFEHIEDKYEILNKLGEGGMGAIFKVRHRLLDEIRVIKVLRPQVAVDVTLEHRFIREARSAIHLRHPNIAQIYDFSLDPDGTAYLVMEYIVGRNFKELLRKYGATDVGLVLDLSAQALTALGYLHRQSFVHRDVSPDNLMLTHDVEGRPRVKLIDLGLAKSLEDKGTLTDKGSFMGKVRYASPEHFGGDKGAPAVDPRSDLYSFGVVLYELLTGRLPIVGSDYSSFIAGHLMRPPVPFEESDPNGRVPPELRAAVLQALSKHPDERYDSAEDFAAELLRISDTLESSGSERWLKAVALDFSEVNSTDGGRELMATENTATIAESRPEVEAISVTPTERLIGLEERTPARPTTAPPPPPQQRSRRWPWVAVPLLLVVAAFAVIQIWGPNREGAPGTDSGIAVTSGTARLQLEAVPWAEVLTLVDSEGRSIALPSPALTPLGLDLDSGRYMVTVRYPNGEFPRTEVFDLEAGTPRRLFFTAGDLTAQDVLTAVGWRAEP